MDKAFVSRMRDELHRQKEEILQHLVEDNEDFKSIVEDMDPKDLVDIAADDVDKKNLEALNAVELKRLTLIESALARIQNERYGICMDCSKLIPTPRLEAIPYALFCVDCKTKHEKAAR